MLIALSVFFVVGIVLVFLLAQEIDKQKRPHLYRGEIKKRFYSETKPKKKPRRASISAEHYQLIQLLNGDHSAAYRLIKGVQKRNPRETYQWCAEKALFDLERDRY
ncbi:hypothetical protein ACQ4M4_18060 [Leptolyngbya sp. AN02str]|uniref:hypothetical protein n=1 Tax=Leptolyngbya sp. AN02str TaxID=3423363 RepID=UPI003D317137